MRGARTLARGLLGSPLAAGLTLLVGIPGAIALLRLWNWAVMDAAFGTTPESCRINTGACWSVIADMWPLFLVGLYPGEERWRVALAALVLAAVFAGGLVAAWRRQAAYYAAVASAVVAALAVLYGGFAGLPVVDPQKWGGLLLTAVLAIVGQTLAFPLGVLLALGRRSNNLPLMRVVSIAFIEVVRAVPLVLVLLLATLILPLFLPPTFPLNTMVMAQVGFIVFSAAALAEVVRGGLQALPPGQEEAAATLGLTYAQTTRLIVLPQALQIVQPALLSTIVSFIKGSSLVVAIGLYDLLGTAMLAAANDKWVGHTVEPLLTVGAIFWAICFGLSRASARIERRRGARPQIAATTVEEAGR